MKKPILILWLGLVAPALFGQNNFLDLQSNGIPASKITGTISTNVLPMSQIVSAGTPGLNGSNGTNGSQGIQGNPGVNGTNNAVTVTNFITLYETNIYVTFFTNSTLVLQTNATTVLQTNAVTINSTNAVTTQQTNAVTINSTNAVTTQQTNFTTVNLTNAVTINSTNAVTTLQTNVVNGGVALSGWPTTLWATNTAAGIKAAGGDTNAPAAYVLNPGNLFTGTITNRVGLTNTFKVSGGLITNKTVP